MKFQIKYSFYSYWITLKLAKFILIYLEWWMPKLYDRGELASRGQKSRLGKRLDAGVKKEWINVPTPSSVFAPKNTWGSNERKNVSMIRVDTFQKDSWENEAYSSSCRPIGRTSHHHCDTLTHSGDPRG